MAGTILTPGLENIEKPSITPEPTQFLEKDKYLSEFQGEEKAMVRENLGVYPKDFVYNKTESDMKLDEAIEKAFNEYLKTKDPHGILPIVKEMIKDFVKEDGSIPFSLPLIGVDPISDYHLVTKRFVDKLLREHINTKDPHKILPEVKDILEEYVKESQVYSKSEVYTKNEVDLRGNLYIKLDGTTPFKGAQSGVDPKLNDHLTTKKYVDSSIQKHLVDVDPHGFTTLLNNLLSKYAKITDIYDRTLTYSKVQIDSIINTLMYLTAKEVIEEHLNEFDPHDILSEVSKFGFVKKDGSIPFDSPQKGVNAVEPLDLVTLQLVNEKVNKLHLTIVDNKAIWITSGPVLSTVGHLDDNTPVPDIMSLLEVLDSIFYGRGVSISGPEYVPITETASITLCINGTVSLVKTAELYLDGELIASFTGSDFKEGCITKDSLPIVSNSELTFRATYTDDSVYEESITIKLALPIFVGLLPKWKFGNTITWEYLEELWKEEPNNNLLAYSGEDLNTISISYNFKDTKLRHPFIVVPEEYPDLKSVSTTSLKFNIEAFDIIDMIPLHIPDVQKDIVFKVYIYKLALSRLNQELTFNFV